MIKSAQQILGEFLKIHGSNLGNKHIQEAMKIYAKQYIVLLADKLDTTSSLIEGDRVDSQSILNLLDIVDSN